MDRLHVGELMQALQFAPGREPSRCIQLGFAPVIVVDLGSEELRRSPRGLRRWCKQLGRSEFGGRAEDDCGTHQVSPTVATASEKPSL